MLNRQDAKDAEVGERRRGRSESGIEPGRELDDLADRVIGAAIEVHRHLGPGFWKRSMRRRWRSNFDFEESLRAAEARSRSATRRCRSAKVGSISWSTDRLIVELKAVEGLAPIHKAQVISYLKATRLHLGLLINFNVPILKNGLQRVILS